MAALPLKQGNFKSHSVGGTGLEYLEEFLKTNCANCRVFAWDQPDLKRSPLKVCRGCNRIFYCSRECQEEHWRKVHRKQCKLFSGAEPSKDLHNRETCSQCAEQEATGPGVFREGNPIPICLFSSSNPKAKELLEFHQKYPLQWTGAPGKRQERILDQLQKLLLKIKLTRHPVSWMYPKLVKIIEEELLFLKMMAFSDRILFPRNYHIPLLDLSKLSNMLSEELRTVVFSDRSFIWQTFLMLLHLLCAVHNVELDQIIKSPEKSLSKEEREWSRRVRNSSFLRVIDQILDALDKQVVSQKDLANIVCDGNVQRVCSICNKEITVQAVYAVSGEERIPGTPWVLFYPGPHNLYYCGAKACAPQRQGLPVKAFSWNMAVVAAVSQLLPTRCDFCFLLAPVDDVHRLFPRKYLHATLFVKFILYLQVCLFDEDLLQQGVCICRQGRSQTLL